MTILTFQNEVANILNENFPVKVNFYSENIRDIEFQIQNALGRQGIVGIVMTPQLDYQGHNSKEPIYSMPDFTIQICENPIVNRAQTNNMTAHEAIILASELLVNVKNKVGLPIFGTFTPTSISIQEMDETILVAEAKFECTFALSSTDEDDDTISADSSYITAQEAFELSEQEIAEELSAIADLI